jgi:hypothetical protein
MSDARPAASPDKPADTDRSARSAPRAVRDLCEIKAYMMQCVSVERRMSEKIVYLHP